MSRNPDWHLRIEHILDAIGKIERYTLGMSEHDFLANEVVVDAVFRNFEIIGEAARFIPVKVRTANSTVPWALMSGMRNVLAQAYFAVSPGVIWRTAKQDLPALIQPLRRM